MTFFRRGLAVAVVGILIALTPSVACAEAPKVEWWWTLAVSASDPNTLVLGTSDGVYRSTDAGKTWRPDGLTGVDATSLVQVGSTLFVGGLRKPAGSKAVVIEAGAYTIPSGPGVLAASTDGGKTWRPLHPRGLPGLDVQALAADPVSSGGLFLLLRAGGLYRSTDGGSSFEMVTPRLGGPPWALAVTQGGHLVAGDMATGNYLSATGKHWQHTAFTDLKRSAMVMEYAVQPADQKRVLMTSYGVEMSPNAGKSWRVVLNSKVMFGPVAWAPSSSAVAYAIGWDRSVWRSDDGGRHWARTS
jgi:photosystem II stability/assembly factor-like uncharacterized protein